MPATESQLQHSLTGITPPESTDVVSYRAHPSIQHANIAAPVPKANAFDLAALETNLNAPPTKSKNPFYTSSDVVEKQPEPKKDVANPLRLSSNNPYNNTAYPRTDAPEQHYDNPYEGYRTNSPDLLDYQDGTGDDEDFQTHTPEQVSQEKNPFYRQQRLTPRSTKTSSYSDGMPTTPLEPSSKALGKLRRFSRNSSDEEEDRFALEMEREREDQLREKYRLEAAEKAERLRRQQQ